MKFAIKKIDSGKRLDVYLTEKLKGKSRGEVQALIAAGGVLISGLSKNKHYRLKENEVVEVKIAKQMIKKNPASKNAPEVIFANKEFLVVNKPAGLIVHGAPHIKQPTLADWLVKKYPALKKVGEDRVRPGIMHRLDKDASGLMVIARTNESFKNLKKQFQRREVEKNYVALVYGVIRKDEDRITFPLRRSSRGYRQAAVPDRYNFRENFSELREAITEIKVARRFANHTLLTVKILSGRKHQIRTHLFAYGYPLVGDDLYSTKKTRAENRKNNLGRIFLVAQQLGFRDLAGRKHHFTVPLPVALENFLKKLK
ncbi:MAG TPA: RluA family pseudouridine synthase [Candidatus Methylomirabilis sp.]|nr:RluA family pseudouridine synthase [Candidatus Methylomirabilis sp.]